MKPNPVEPFEISYKETTNKEFAETVLHGGWVEYHTSCPLCKLHHIHRHYICNSCGKIDFASKETCIDCHNASEIFRIRRKLMRYVRREGYALLQLGIKFVLVLALLTILSWRLV